MGTITRGAKAGGGTSYNTGQTISATEVNDEMTDIYTVINGEIDDANIKTAEMPGSKSFRFTEISDPSSPAANDLLLYAKDDAGGVSRLATKDSGGTVRLLAGLLNANTTSQATTGTTKQTLASYSLPANILNTNGRTLRITAWFITAANGNSKTVTIDFGGATINSYVEALNDGDIILTALIVRSGASTQEIALTSGSSATAVRCDRTTAAITDTAAITIAATATTASASGDATFKGLVVELLS